MPNMSEGARAARREYQREYRARRRATMSEEQKEARRAYHRAWSHAHPDRVKKHTADYWERRAAAKAKAEEARVKASDFPRE